jgi:hypothetical protein
MMGQQFPDYPQTAIDGYPQTTPGPFDVEEIADPRGIGFAMKSYADIHGCAWGGEIALSQIEDDGEPADIDDGVNNYEGTWHS